jgi:mannose-6-phosphate isomerase-like protein (cupin superfamily)
LFASQLTYDDEQTEDMIHCQAEKTRPKGWFVGPWNSNVPIPIGYANQGINEKHYHAQMTEIYLVASGESTAVVDGKEVALAAGDILVVEPGEVHTFTNNSADYYHFVIHTPFVRGDKVLVE